jgi:hypothetical protein
MADEVIGRDLLDQAKAAGLTVRVEGHSLIVRGRRRVESLAQRLIDHKPDVLAALAEREPTSTRAPATAQAPIAPIKADVPAALAEAAPSAPPVATGDPGRPSTPAPDPHRIPAVSADDARDNTRAAKAAPTDASDCCPRCGRHLDAGARCWPCHYRRCVRCGRETGSPFIELCMSCEAKALKAGEELPRGWAAESLPFPAL